MTGDAPASTGARSVFCLCAAEVLTMVGVFSFPALLPSFVAEWSLTGAEAGWISGATFAGYALAVPFLAALTDRVDAKLVYLAGALFAAVSVMGFALAADGFWTAFAWRLLGGVGLAGTYMPGLKALMDRTSGARQPRWISYYTASFSLGTSGSFLMTGAMAGAFGWRAAFGLAAATAAAAFLLVAFILPSVRPVPPEHKNNPFDFGEVLRNRAAMAYVFGYSSHTWELFGARSWMVAFLSWVLASQPGASGPSPTAVATIGALLAMVASVVGADMAVRFDRRRLCILAMLGSGALAAVIGFCSGLPYGAVAALMLLYSMLIQVDSAALTTGALLAAAPDRRGATLSVHSLLGFSAGFIGPLAFGIVLDRAGGANTGLAWGLAFASLGAVAALGPLALRRR
jgi:predicted MFS family arabinose efflux permease